MVDCVDEVRVVCCCMDVLMGPVLHRVVGPPKLVPGSVFEFSPGPTFRHMSNLSLNKVRTLHCAIGILQALFFARFAAKQRFALLELDFRFYLTKSLVLA